MRLSLRRRRKTVRELAVAPDSVRIWGLSGNTVPPAEPRPDPDWLPALCDLVYELMESEDFDDRVVAVLEGGLELIPPDRRPAIAASTAAAMHSAAAVGYMSRRAEAEIIQDQDSGDELAPEAPGPQGDAELGSRAIDLASRVAIDQRLVPVRERTLSLAVRRGDNGTLLTPDGEVGGATVDDFRRAWTYGYFVRRLIEPRSEA